MDKRIYKILIIVVVMGIFFSMPVFSETVADLQSIFVSRKEWTDWLNVNGASNAASVTGMSDYLSTLEQNAQVYIKDEVKYAMWRRDILRGSLYESMTGNPGWSATLQSWLQRKAQETAH